MERHAGTDMLRWQGERLTVWAPRAMPSWHPRRYRRIAVVFRGTRYCVVATREAAGGFEYDLEPWPELLHELPGEVIVYDEGYVRERDEAWRALRGRRVEYAALLPLRPLVGFLWSSVKARMHDRYGIDPRGATVVSLYLEVAAMMLAGTYFAVGGWTGDVVPVLFTIGKSFPILLVDVVVRAGASFGETAPPWGFYEWLYAAVVRVVRGGR